MKFSLQFGRKAEHELDDEFQFHLEQEIQKNIASGMSAEQARRQARLAFGLVESRKQECRDVRLGYWLETTLQDLSFGLRMLRKSRGFTLVAVVMLALGIGANTAMFSAVNAVLLTRWPFPHPGKIVVVSEGAPPKADWSLVSVPNYEDYARENKTFDQLSLWIAQSVNLTGQERPDRLIGSFVSANFFEMFGTKPKMGRVFLPGEDQPGADYVAVLSHEAWQTRFGGNPNILGRQIKLNGESYTVVGVLPRAYRLPLESDVYITAQHHTSYRRDRSTRPLLIMGRVKESVSLEQAQADLNTIAHRLARDYPTVNAGIGVAVSDFRDVSQRFVRTPLLVLLGGVALVLLIACANLSNLLLARGAGRQRELAVRAALGARRSRTVRQLVSEAMQVAVLGGVAGVALAHWALPPLLRLAPSTFDVSSVAVIDGRVLLFSLALTFLTGLFFGAIPAMQLSQLNVASALGAANRGAVQTGAREKIKGAFVVCQVAMSITLLIGAGLLVRSFRVLLATDTGMSIRNLLTMEYRLPRNKYPKPETQSAFHRELALRVAQVPGVVSSAIIRSLPFSGNWGQIRFLLPDQPTPEKGKEPGAFENAVTPEYFQTAGLPLLRGRNFNDHDDGSAPLLAVVSRAFADRYFGGQDPLGRTVQLVDSDPERDGKRVTIIGLVANAKQRSLRDTDEAQMYFSYTQQPAIFGTLVVRTAVEPMSLAEPVRQAVWSLDKDQPVWKVRTLQFLVERDVEADRFLVVLMTGFGILALLLSALGTYGILSNGVNDRRQEIGVRMALGAQAKTVRRWVIGQGMKLVLIGGLVGVIAAAAGSRMLSTVLYGIGTLDFPAYAAGWALMTAVAFVASYLPARRATRIDPMAALRCE